jgi:hypothetical protein
MLKFIRESILTKIIAVFLLVNVVTQLIFPNIAFALTGGPSQPEVQSFEPIGTSDMVDVFSGDFNYNIPLLDVDGYPINISYHSGITMDQEASWVGLGWNINPGVINRNMRGIPDDFDGDVIQKQYNMKANNTYGITGGLSGEIFGLQGLSAGYSLGVSYNNYTGVGIERSLNASFSAAQHSKTDNTSGMGVSLGLNSSSENGLTINPSLSFDSKMASVERWDRSTAGVSVGCSFNSRSGLKALTLSANASRSDIVTDARIASGGLGSSINFGMTTYVPSSSMSRVNTSLTLSLKGGAEFYGLEPNFTISGYFSSQRIASRSANTRSYGYLNAEKGINLDEVLLDFNREKDLPYNKNTPALPVTNFTYDVYSVSGQGIGGSYRPFRSDIGSVFDSYSGSTSESGSIGVELGVGNLAKGGTDVSVNNVTSYTGKWRDDNPAAQLLKFKGKKGSDITYEPYYFKQAGEKFVDSDKEFFENVGKYDAVRVALAPSGFSVPTKNKFINANGTEINIPANQRNKRQKRNEVITLLNRKEADDFGLQSPGELDLYNAPKHHIAEVTSLRADGARYVYGIAAYNTQQEEVTFSTGKSTSQSQRQADCEKGLVQYNNGDNSVDNQCGLDNYFSNTILPAYAHSYLLTAVLSSDYVDNDGLKGPSKNDLGNYTKFSYDKISDYQWRVPFEGMRANYNEGLKSDVNDDQGNYVYGKKELWYLDSITTKNYIAIFYKSPRKDAVGVTNNDGGINTSVKMQQLDSIKLYSKKDLVKPIKVVHFVYDYTLCKEIPNFDGASNAAGKLTLKKIYFTYGDSKKGALSPYEFDYDADNSDHNPKYNLKGYDRWGNYKPNAGNNCSAIDPNIPTYEFPYVDQDKTTADEYSAAWSLKKITLPSGGTINIEYESDDYAYVQNKQAMEMFKITGVSGSGSATVPTGPAAKSLNEHQYIYFPLHALANSELPDDDISDPGQIQQIGKKYLNGIQDLYFRVLVKMTQSSSSYEYVSGYASLEGGTNFGLASDGSVSGKFTHGWIKIKTVPIGDKNGNTDVNPIAKAAWQFGRLNTPRLIRNQPNVTDNGLRQVAEAMVNSGIIKNLVETIYGQNRLLKDQGYGDQIMLNKSWVRLLNPDQKKLGGGCRVKKIMMTDEWSSMLGSSPSETSSYGQEYSYTTIDPLTGNTISSGVASYEPMLGGDENPWRQPVYNGTKEENLLAPDDKHYMEEPFGESFFPSPSVGYSQVTVKNLQYENVKRNATGYVVHEFYTAKDFPTIVQRTDLRPEPARTNSILSLFKINVKDYMTVSQGYSIQLNDMHGKPKGQKVYAEGQSSPISGIEYKYQTKNGVLNNEVAAISKTGAISKELVGVDFDMVADMREQSTSSTGAGANGNLAAFLVFIFPGFVPLVLPTMSSEHTRFRSSVVTKVINTYGVLSETIAFDGGSKITTSNLAYDAETGEVLVTRTTNEFMDDIYVLNYPAHWSYDRMGQAYKNIGISVSLDANFLGVGIPGNVSDYFVLGDEITAWDVTGNIRGWVTDVDNATNKITIIDKAGTNLTLTGKVKVIRSGRRNQQAISVGQITMKKNPIDINNDGTLEAGLDLNKNYLILNASAIEFMEDSWKTDCKCLNILVNKNPYTNGLKGTWRNKRSYTYLTGRNQSHLNNNTDVRNDGFFTDFSPFWNKPSASADWIRNTDNWTSTTEVTEFSPFGMEIENKDALDRYSTALYGYNNTVPVLVTSNSKRKESGFDGFEDYYFNNCTDDHFNFKEFKTDVISTESHSGRNSIRVLPANEVKITKSLKDCE